RARPETFPNTHRRASADRVASSASQVTFASPPGIRLALGHAREAGPELRSFARRTCWLGRAKAIAPTQRILDGRRLANRWSRSCLDGIGRGHRPSVTDVLSVRTSSRFDREVVPLPLLPAPVKLHHRI